MQYAVGVERKQYDVCDSQWLSTNLKLQATGAPKLKLNGHITLSMIDRQIDLSLLIQ